MSVLDSLRRDQRGFTLAEFLVSCAILGLVMAGVLGIQMTSNTMFLRGENQAEAQQAARAAMLMEEDLRMAGYGCPDAGCPTPPAGTKQKITAASPSSISFWADTLDASTQLSADVTAGATVLSVVDAGRINVNDQIYINNGATWETRVVTAKASANDHLTVAALTNAYAAGAQVGRPRLIVYAYTPAAGTLTKDAGDGNAQPLATGITNLTFTFYFSSTYITPDAQIPPGNLNAANLGNIGRIQIQTTAQSAQSAAGPSTYTINTNVRPRNL